MQVLFPNGSDLNLAAVNCTSHLQMPRLQRRYLLGQVVIYILPFLFLVHPFESFLLETSGSQNCRHPNFGPIRFSAHVQPNFLQLTFSNKRKNLVFFSPLLTGQIFFLKVFFSLASKLDLKWKSVSVLLGNDCWKNTTFPVLSPCPARLCGR